jgi:hypothetical protein
MDSPDYITVLELRGKSHGKTQPQHQALFCAVYVKNTQRWGPKISKGNTVSCNRKRSTSYVEWSRQFHSFVVIIGTAKWSLYFQEPLNIRVLQFQPRMSITSFLHRNMALVLDEWQYCTRPTTLLFLSKGTTERSSFIATLSFDSKSEREAAALYSYHGNYCYERHGREGKYLLQCSHAAKQ